MALIVTELPADEWLYEAPADYPQTEFVSVVNAHKQRVAEQRRQRISFNYQLYFGGFVFLL